MKYLAVLIVFVSLAFAPVHGQAQSSQLTPALLDALLNFVAKKEPTGNLIRYSQAAWGSPPRAKDGRAVKSPA